MLERDYLMIQYLSKEIVDRRINVLTNGMMHDAASGKDNSFLGSLLNVVGILALSLFLLILPL